MPDRAPDHASLDREQAREWALWLRDPTENKYGLSADEEVGTDLVLAYEAELVRVERERDEAQRKFVRSLTTRREFVAMKLAQVERERDEEEGRVDSLMLSVEAAQARIARLETQLAEARKVVDLVHARRARFRHDLPRSAEEIALDAAVASARAGLAASAETPEAPDAA